MRLLLHVGFFIRLIRGSTSLRIPFASLRLEEYILLGILENEVVARGLRHQELGFTVEGLSV